MAYRETEKMRNCKAEARRRIIECTQHCVAEGGFRNARVTGIADCAGVATGTIYREFQTTDDIRAADHLLERIMSLDKLFDLLDIEDPQEQSHLPLTYQNLLLTVWASHCRGFSETLPVGAAIPLKEFKAFFTTLWDAQNPPSIRAAVKTSFTQWVAATSGLTFEEISFHYGEIFTDLFKEIEEAFAKVAVEDLDPRFINLFRVDY